MATFAWTFFEGNAHADESHRYRLTLTAEPSEGEVCGIFAFVEGCYMSDHVHREGKVEVRTTARAGKFDVRTPLGEFSFTFRDGDLSSFGGGSLATRMWQRV